MRQLQGLITTLGEGVQTQIVVEHCCHCGGVIGEAAALLAQRVRGEGAFGYCSRCHALHHAHCAECRPQEQGCDNVEAGRDWHDDGTAQRVFLPTAFPGK